MHEQGARQNFVFMDPFCSDSFFFFLFFLNKKVLVGQCNFLNVILYTKSWKIEIKSPEASVSPLNSQLMSQPHEPQECQRGVTAFSSVIHEKRL